MKAFTERRIIMAVRWTARAIGISLLVLIAAFAIGEGVPNPLQGSLSENLLFIGFQAMAIGQIVAWKWEGIAGVLILSGFGLFAIVNHGVPLNIVFGPWLVTGLLYLLCWWRTPRTVVVQELHGRRDRSKRS